jgi:glycosyltransferase involved in cell wall biosynthesis
MKRHVLFIVENNSVPRDVRVWSEARSAKEFGFDVSVICPEDKLSDSRDSCVEGIHIYAHPQPIDRSSKLGLLLEYANALFWELVLSLNVFIRHRFHIIHAANPPDHIFLIALVFKIFGVKFIFDHHDIAPENYVAKFGKKGFFYWVLRLMEWLTFKTADAVIATNDSYKEMAIKRGGRNEENVFVVRNGPDLSKIARAERNAKLRDGFKYLVGYVGTIGQQEGIDNLLRIAKYIVEAKGRKDIKFIVVGTGPYWENVKQLSLDMGLKGFVWFTGYIPVKELHEILETVDVCVNPEHRNSFTDKSTMIKVMEYMFFEKPIVQFYTKEGEVTAGESALYIRNNSEPEFAEALINLLEDNRRREIMGFDGRKRIEEQLCWDRQKGKMKEAYDHIDVKI